ncbi:MAG: FtsW/RodA/SpoVE family cell cycle protein, partial [Acutalibacter sp.]
VLAGAVLAVFVILSVNPYVLDRFLGWGHVWDHINDEYGYQQTRTLTYMASGGLFGLGLGNSYLASVFAADSDLVFGLLCEQQGLLLGLVVLLAFVLWVFYARSDVTRSRSTFFSIAACAAAGMLLFQTTLNVFGATDVLPMTGVTLPFISSGGSSMISVWGMMAFLKASDERTYAARRASRRSLREEAPPPPSRTPQSRAPQRAPAPRPQASPSRGRVTPPAPQRAPARSPAPRGGSHARKPAGRHSRKEA